MIRILMADDDVFSKNNIRSYLAQESGVQIIGDVSDGIQARDRLHVLEPDIFIINVQLPRLSGFELLGSATCERMPYVIFTSASDRYAAEAYQFNGIGYLVKPFDKHRFQDLFTRVRRYIERDLRAEGHIAVDTISPNFQQVPTRPSPDRLPVKVGRRIRLIDARAICHVVTDREHANLHMTTGEVIRTSERISKLDLKLPPDSFQRIQRSIIVNLAHIRDILLNKSNYEFVMRDGSILISGILYRRELHNLISTWCKSRGAA